MYRCGHIAFNHFHNEYRRCSHRCRRNTIHLHTDTHHKYTISRSQDAGFPVGFRANDAHGLDEEQTHLQRLLGEFAGECNLSGRAIASSSMVHFVRSVLELGISLGRASPTVTAEMLAPSISAKKVNKMVRLSGEARAEAVLSQYRDRRFVNLVCDAGTVQNLHTVYALVTNPYCRDSPFIAAMIDSTQLTGDDYAAFFENTLIALFADELVVCGVVVDNLAAQSLGLRRALELSENPAVRTVSHIPCFCHAINLVFTNSIRDCPALQRVMATLSGWEAVFRTSFARRVMPGTKRCPSVPKTRWLYATDSLRWISTHLQDIRSLVAIYREADDEEIRRLKRNPILDLLGEDDVEEQFQAMADCLCLLQPLRSLCDRLEQRDATLSVVIPAVRDTLEAYRNLHSAQVLQPSSDEILRHILSRFIARMATNAEDLCVTAYVFSLEGRDEVRAREEGFTTFRADSQADLDRHDRTGGCWPEALEVDEERTARDDRAVPDDSSSDEERTGRDDGAVPDSSSSDEELVKDIFEDELDPIDEEAEEVPSYRELQSDLFHGTAIDGMFAYPLYCDLMSKADRCVESLADRLGMSPDESVQSLHDWIETAGDPLWFPRLGDRSPDTIWRHAHQSDRRRDFSEIAMRIVTLGTSEADVERMISTHRDVASLQGTRYSHRTLRSRLQLRVTRARLK
jgi:hypothetical protein